MKKSLLAAMAVLSISSPFAPPIAVAQRAEVFVLADEANLELARNIEGELTALGYRVVRVNDVASVVQGLSVVCAGTEVRVMLRAVETSRTLVLSALAETTTVAIRTAEAVRALELAAPGSTPEIPEAPRVGRLSNSVQETQEAEPAQGTLPVRGVESQPLDPPNDRRPGSMQLAPPQPDNSEGELAAPATLTSAVTAGADTLVGFGGDAPSLGAFIQVRLTVSSVISLCLRAAQSLASPTLDDPVLGPVVTVETSQLKLSGNLSYPWALSSTPVTVDLGAGLGALWLSTQGSSRVQEVVGTTASGWLGFGYLSLSPRVAFHEHLSLLVDARALLFFAKANVASSSPLTTAEFGGLAAEISLGLEVQWDY